MIRMLPILALICLGLAVILSVLIWPTPRVSTPLKLHPSQHKTILIKIASDEHALDLLPHNDRYVKAVCAVCQTPEDRMGIEANRKAELSKMLHYDTPMHDKNGYP